MADWQRKVMLNPEWDRAKNGEMPLHELARSIARKLRAMMPLGVEDIDDELLDIIDEFEGAGEDPSLTICDVDYIMRSLYDWADTPLDGKWNGKKVCWVDSITHVEAAE